VHVATDYIGKLRLPISPERLESYRPAAGTDLDTVVNYFWNLCLCEALYPSLNAAEISLRNSIHTALSSHYQNDYWFDDENVVESRQYQQVLKARETLRHREKEETAGRIVAELTSGSGLDCSIGRTRRRSGHPTGTISCERSSPMPLEEPGS